MSFAIHLCNWHDVEVRADIDNDGWIGGSNTDGVHFNGPGLRARGEILVHATDDCLALNADDGNVSYMPFSGDITDVDMRIETWNGRSNTYNISGVRLLSTVARLDNVTIRATGVFHAGGGLLLDAYNQSLLPGSGNIGHIVFENTTIDGQPDGSYSTGVVTVNANVETLEVRGRYTIGSSTSAGVGVKPSYTLGTLILDWTAYTPASSAYAVLNSVINEPIVRVEGTVRRILGTVRSVRDPGVAVGAAPIVRIMSGANIDLISLRVDADRITNLIDYAGGSLTTLRLQGSHRLAGGGSPLAIAAGCVLPNYVTAGLMYDHNNVPAFTGAGTITRNGDYNEAVTVASAYTTTLSSTSGTTGTAVTVTFAPTGGAWPTGEIITPTESGVTGAFSPATLSPTGSGSATATWTPTAPNTGTAAISSTTSPSMTNTTGSQNYTVAAGPATAYTTSLSATSGATGSPVTMTFTPTAGSWPASEVITPTASGIAGTFSPTSLSPTGSGAVTATWTPTSPATGTATLNSTAAPSMTNTTGAESYTVNAAGASFALNAGAGWMSFTPTAISVVGSALSFSTPYTGTWNASALTATVDGSTATIVANSAGSGGVGSVSITVPAVGAFANTGSTTLANVSGIHTLALSDGTNTLTVRFFGRPTGTNPYDGYIFFAPPAAYTTNATNYAGPNWIITGGSGQLHVGGQSGAPSGTAALPSVVGGSGGGAVLMGFAPSLVVPPFGPADNNYAANPPRNPGRFDVTKLGPMLADVHERLAGVVIERLPYAELMRRYDGPTTLFYLDPPYWGCEADYGPGFAHADFEHLVDQLAGLRGRWIMSINDTPEIRTLFHAAELEEVTVTYTIGDRPTRARELILSGGGSTRSKRGYEAPVRFPFRLHTTPKSAGALHWHEIPGTSPGMTY